LLLLLLFHRKYMQEAAEGEVGQIEVFLNNVTLLKGLTKEQRLRLVDAFTEAAFPAESVIIKEGDAGDKFYIIKT
jgi:cAMP-dependent protein kinase regulator